MTTQPSFQVGLMLPHFGRHAARELIIEGCQSAEEYGFDSVWVRDHLLYQPHGMEDPNRTFIDPFVALSAVASATNRLKLGTGALIPYRHPVHLATSLDSLNRIAPGRVIAGMGIGNADHEFETVGLGNVDRRELIGEQTKIVRKLLSGETVSHTSDVYKFESARLNGNDGEQVPIPLWYCGNSKASVRRAVEYCDGWMPGRITLRTFRERVDRLRAQSEAAGRETPTVGSIPITSIGPTRYDAVAKVDWRGMLEQAIRSRWELPNSGKWESPDDLEGALLAGAPADIVEQTLRYRDAGLHHIVYDLRNQFGQWKEGIAVLGEEVLPKVRN